MLFWWLVVLVCFGVFVLYLVWLGFWWFTCFRVSGCVVVVWFLATCFSLFCYLLIVLCTLHLLVFLVLVLSYLFLVCVLCLAYWILCVG